MNVRKNLREITLNNKEVIVKEIVIIDGNNWFRRHYYKSYIAGDTENTFKSVVRSFLVMRKNSLKGKQIIFTFDTCKSQTRLDLYPEYKGTRKSSLSPEQYEMYNKIFPLVIKFFQQLGYRVLEGDGYEADDYIAMLTFMLKRSNKVTIMSTDGDFPQLVDKSVSVYNPTKKITITNENFFNMIGIDKSFYVEMKCLAGDTSDNIIGIDGVGEKTAMKYLNKYGNFNDIKEYLYTKPPKKLNGTDKKMLTFKGMELNKKLIDLELVKNDKKLQQLIKEKVQNVTKYNRETFFNFLAEHGLTIMMDEL